jgi:DNA-nicking Smr family endonuclease
MAKRSATEAERSLWSAAMRDVRRLRTEPATVPPPVPGNANAAPAAPEPAPAPAKRRSPGDVDRATLERLKRGRVTIEARIDLHGMTQGQAFSALLGFVDSSARAGRRAILIITGKGAVSEGGGVLRRNVPSWLAASPLAGRILTIAPAHLRHGGDGALYVLLRKASR